MSIPTQAFLHQSRQVTNGQKFYALLALLPVVLVGWMVVTYALNLPYWDDFLVQEHLLILKNGSRSQKLKYHFDQHWEHRITWTRLVFALFAKVNGSLNYYGLTLIGFGGLLAMLGVLFAVFRRLACSLLYFVPIPFLLFSLQSYENLIWAMASIQNFWIVTFALVAFYGLAQNTKKTRWLAVGLAVLATFTSGNGFLILICGLFVLAYQRHWHWLGGWAFATLLVLAGYFYTYDRILFFPSPFRYPISDWIVAFFVFLGGFADHSPNASNGPLGANVTVWLTMAVGVVVVGITGNFLISALGLFRTATVDRMVSFLLGCFLFLVTTAAITVYSRVGFAGPVYLLQSRYKIYSALAISLVYLYGLYRWRNRGFRPRRYVGCVLILIIGQSLLSDYLCLAGIVNQRRRVVAEYFNYAANTDPERQRAIEQVFKPTDPPPFSHVMAQLLAPAWWSAPATTTVDSVEEQPFMYNISKADAINPTLSQSDNGSYIFFKSLSHTYLFAAQPRRSSPIFLPDGINYFAAHGFYAQVLKEKLEPGQYRIGVLTNQNNRTRLAMTNRYVTFTSL